MKPVDLFEKSIQLNFEKEQPLAARMRPRTLDEFIGQDHIVGHGRLLRRAIQADRLSSLIFFGPPGTGKTTLARVIANSTSAHFAALNAVLAGVKDIREAVTDAQERRKFHNQKTILFVDEVHRFNKAQQDALLPWVENGTVIFIGATTENPYFEVNRALVSRSRIFQLKPLTPDDLRRIVRGALDDRERGYGSLPVDVDPDALDHLVNIANGDARALYNALELAVQTTPPDEAGRIRITLAVAEESIQQRAVLYDKEGDAHFDTISAFIKSVRGSDPDAALYWLAKMVYAGEDPDFIFRRLLILAGEDIGLADPNGIVVVNACAQAYDRIGLPEGRYHLTLATLYLATTAKSNSAMGFFDALGAVEKEREGEVPNHLKDGTRDKEGLGHGSGYLYPHAYRDHWVAQQYLPAGLRGKLFFQPSDQGHEARIAADVARRRELQLAAFDQEVEIVSGEHLTTGPVDKHTERWLARAVSRTTGHLAQVRETVFELADVRRHHLVLDLCAGTGLLTWEAVRQTPEGGVVTLARNAAQAEVIRELALNLASEAAPTILAPDADDAISRLPDALTGMVFDRVLGLNALRFLADPVNFISSLKPYLATDAVLVLVEPGLSETERARRILEAAGCPDKVLTSISSDGTATEVSNLPAHLFPGMVRSSIECDTSVTVTDRVLASWLDEANPRSFFCLVAHGLDDEERNALRRFMRTGLLGRDVAWRTHIDFLVARLSA